VAHNQPLVCPDRGAMPNRFEYFLDLSDLDQCSSSMTVSDLRFRAAQPTDAQVLGELMLDAYKGTIDYDDETLDDAVNEVQAYLAGERGGQALLSVSRLAFEGSVPVSACLAGDWHERQCPMIAYVMTRAQWKNLGVGQQVLCAVLQALRDQGHREVRAVITEGNTPSERLFGRLGFRRVTRDG
jgi:L-amino acid N-acyltransferase YncA